MQELHITTAVPADLPAVLALNEQALPHVNSLTLNTLRELVDQSCYCSIARVGQQVAGFLLALGPDQAYRSLNYRWFCERYDRFVYVDRVVIADAFQGMGVGKALYQDVERVAGRTAGLLTCEVNLVPPNPGSLAFHYKLGFVEVGQQDTDGGEKRVSLLSKPVAA